MTSLNIRPDDMGLRSRGRDVTHTPLEPSAPAAPVHNEGRDPQPAKGTHQRQERRKNQRRKHNVPVLLDTRSQRDRRQNTGSGTEADAPGVDVYA